MADEVLKHKHSHFFKPLSWPLTLANKIGKKQGKTIWAICLFNLRLISICFGI